MASSFSPSNENILPGRKFQCFIDLITNDNETFLSAGGILLRFANNVLKDPSNAKYRNINLCNEIFMSKLLPVHGAVDCLFGMGFKEESDKLLLEFAADLEDLKSIRDAIGDEISKRLCAKTNHIEVNPPSNEKLEESKVETSDNKVSEEEISQTKEVNVAEGGQWSQIPLKFSPQQRIFASSKILDYIPRLDTHGKREYYDKMISPIDQIFLYESKELQKLTLSVIPLETLEQQAISDYEIDLEHNKGNATLSMKDYLLLHLLAWFKKDFFTWTNSPSCNKCGRETKFNSSDIPNPEERVWNCGNVECYQCIHCYSITRFPRFNHPQKLLETRTGRCGEWANCFTLCCRAVGFEARYILDFTDHVWTEVYSDYQKRWLHCDSCENVCDKPLLYESGWNKKLSYVIAFSKDEIIDVTWRYSALHKDLMSRRKAVPEDWLIDFYTKASRELQSVITDDERKSVLMNRHIVEIVEFLTPRDKSKGEDQGRISGSLAWRTARGEAGEGKPDNKKSCVFRPTKNDILSKRMKVQYFPAKDYYVVNDSTTIQGWQNGAEFYENIFRKVESDWKMVYLARSEGSEKGTIKWSIDIQDTSVKISHVSVKIHSKLYESGKIDFKLYSENHSMDFSIGNNISTDNFSGSRLLHLDACLKGSTGDVAWQHAQLFRCADSDEKFVGLEFDVSFCD